MVVRRAKSKAVLQTLKQGKERISARGTGVKLRRRDKAGGQSHAGVLCVEERESLLALSRAILDPSSKTTMGPPLASCHAGKSDLRLTSKMDSYTRSKHGFAGIRIPSLFCLIISSFRVDRWRGNILTSNSYIGSFLGFILLVSPLLLAYGSSSQSSPAAGRSYFFQPGGMVVDSDNDVAGCSEVMLVDGWDEQCGLILIDGPF